MMREMDDLQEIENTFIEVGCVFDPKGHSIEVQDPHKLYKAIQAKMNEVDRAAYTRATKYHLIVLRDTLVEPPIRTVSRVHAAIELLEKELASLKGGDV